MATVLDLVRLCRQRLVDFGGDTPDPEAWITDDADCKWSNIELTDYLDQAHAEHMDRVDFEDSSSSLCSLTLAIGASKVELSPCIREIKDCRLVTDDKELRYKTPRELYELSTTCDLQWYTLERGRNTLSFRGAPTKIEYIKLVVVRYPSFSFSWPLAQSQKPELNEIDHKDLVDYALSLAYLKRDSDTYNKQKSDEYEARFTKRVGPKRSARERNELRGAADFPLRTKICPL